MEAWNNRFLVPTLMDPDHTKTETMFRKQVKYLNKEDQKVFGDEETIQLLVTIFKRVYRQGSTKGLAEEMRLVMRDCFEIEDVKHDNTRLWYDTKDANTPRDMGSTWLLGSPVLLEGVSR